MCPRAESSQSHCGDNHLEGTLSSRLHICYAHFASVRFEQSAGQGSLKTTIYSHPLA